MYTFHQNNGQNIFVFGSNIAGRHGAGAALEAAKNWDAEYGVGEGRTGQSYAIPTKDKDLNTLPLSSIKLAVLNFLSYAKFHQELTFLVTAIGCGLASYKHEDIAPFFMNAPDNCVLPEEWLNIINKDKK